MGITSAERGREAANDYMRRLYKACGDKLLEGGSYGGKSGHLRFARETGAALPDFNDEGQKEVQHSSYSVIYVRTCLLRPILDAKDWVAALLIGKQHSEEIRRAR